MTTPTAAEIAAMPDRELDVLLAELTGNPGAYRCLAEHHPTDDGVFCYRCGKNVNETPLVPLSYSTDHAAAAQAVALLIQKKPEAEINIDYNPEGWSVEWLLMDEKYNAITTRRCATEPRAKAECCVLVLLKMKESEDD